MSQKFCYDSNPDEPEFCLTPDRISLSNGTPKQFIPDYDLQIDEETNYYGLDTIEQDFFCYG